MYLFFRQFLGLSRKNWVVLWKHPFLNLLRCFLMPFAYGVFLALAQDFLIKPNNYGIGNPVPVYGLSQQFNDKSLSLIWADGTNGAGVPSAQDIMNHITSDFSTEQLSRVKQVSTPDDIPHQCPQNFQLYSECFAAVVFNSLPAQGDVNYTIRADAGLYHIDVFNHNSDYEKRLLPLQFAIDQAIINLKTGTLVPVTMEWPFTQETNQEQATQVRLSFIRGLRTLLVIALFIGYIGIAYQLPGAFAGERANLVTAHMKAMGLLDSARMFSWHLSISLAYIPAWILVSIVWKAKIFTATSILIILVVHLLLGFSLASWSLFVAAPFGKSPQLAAVFSTFIGILLAILALVLQNASTSVATIYTLVFPPGFYIFAIRAICGFENHEIATNAFQPDPDRHLRLFPLLIVALINTFLWPYLGVLWERRLYEAREPKTRAHFWQRREKQGVVELPPDIAISIKNLGKTFSTKLFNRQSGIVTAISDLSFDIPKFGMYVLLGSNGAGKSTALSIIGGLLGRSRGSVTFEGGLSRPPRGTIGIVPQKNVLFPDLTCFQTLKVWRAIKWSSNSLVDEDLAQLLRDCDLEKKIHANADRLSGGQKRKLQLAIGLVGGSKIVLVDECTSGVDPLSRRALWRTLTSFRNERTILFTTHFLDEADLLADHIAILAAPGTLVAEGSPVSLKRTLGVGYSVQVTYTGDKEHLDWTEAQEDVLRRIRDITPDAYLASSSPYQSAYQLGTRDPRVVESVLTLLEDHPDYGALACEVFGTSIEDIFLKLMDKPDPEALPAIDEKEEPRNSSGSASISPPLPLTTIPMVAAMELTSGRSTSPLTQALTIFHKRTLIFRRSWLTNVLQFLIAVAGTTIPLVFMAGRTQSCTTKFANSTDLELYLPASLLDPFFDFSNASRVQVSPPGIISALGQTANLFRFSNITDNATFISDIQQNYRNLSLGGISMDLASGNSLIAWEATAPGLNGMGMLNLATNVLYRDALKSSDNSSLIRAYFSPFPPVDAGTLVALKWVAFFGATMSVFPAFFALYVSRERRSSVQAMQLSNGLSNPLGLWLGHLLFDSVWVFLASTVIIIIFAAASNQFHGLGFFWLILVLYGLAGALFSYALSFLVASPLAAFATVAGYQIVMFLCYLAGYLLTLTYAKTSLAGQYITIIHFTLSLLSPVASVMRASLVSVNLFSLLCQGPTPVTASSLGIITRYGGPIAYLFVWGLVLLGILVWIDSGSFLPRKISAPKLTLTAESSNANQFTLQENSSKPDVVEEAQQVAQGEDILRVLQVTKSYDGTNVVDNVSFGVPRDTVFAMLGPNGAGKTTTFNLIRGDVIPDKGDIFIDGVSVVHHPMKARLSLGVCPQFTAIDSQLTVREHLLIYGRLKGLRRGEELAANVQTILVACALHEYADRLASKLSGGNQRKLSLAIALIGDPSVILIDEFSTGVDAKMKRDMWVTLKNVAVGKSLVITTHSMEEASALANKVGIIAKKMLAIGSTESLSARYATYEVHFSCRNREDVTRAQTLMALIPGSRMADDVATRFEVPIRGTQNTTQENDPATLSLAQLFHVLSSQGDFSDYTVEKGTLETIFLKVIRKNNVLEEEMRGDGRKRWWRRKFW